MSAQETTPFSGVAGRVMVGTMSPRSLVTGILLGLTMLFSNWILITADAAPLTTAVNHVLFAVVCGRFVLNGQFGEWQGSLFSAAGGSWVEVLQVSMRFLALTFLWLLPLIFLGLTPEAGPQMMNQKMIVLLLLYVIASILTPPLMLIVAVSADSFVELFLPEHWRKTFSGRRTDLLAIYTTYTGGMTMAVLLSAPSVIIAFAIDVQVGAVVAGLAFCFLLGMSLDLLGRLCGFFSLGDLGEAEAASAGASPTPTVEAPLPASRPVAIAAPAPVVAPTTAATAPPVPAQPAPAAPSAGSGKKPPLLNSKQHVDQILTRFNQNPAAAITALEDLRKNYAVDSQVLGRLCICRFRMGEVDMALLLAGEALPLAFERGHLHLTADLFRELRSHVGKLDLNREQMLSIAAAAVSKGDLTTAGEAFSMVLCKDPGETRAIEGMLDVAERILREQGKPAVALKVYRFLEQHCSGSPLADRISRGIAVAEKRLARSPAPA